MDKMNDFSVFVDRLLDIGDEFSLNGKNDVGENIATAYRHIQASKADFDDRDYVFEA